MNTHIATADDNSHEIGGWYTV